MVDTRPVRNIFACGESSPLKLLLLLKPAPVGFLFTEVPGRRKKQNMKLVSIIQDLAME